MTEYAPVATAAVANMDSNLTGIHTPSCRVPGPDRASREVSQSAMTTRVADGTRTHDHRDHNPGLYQLSYRHRGTRQDSRVPVFVRRGVRLCRMPLTQALCYKEPA